MFADRDAAGVMLAERLRGRPMVRPLVLAIPRGGVAVGAALARELGAELDVVLARKLRMPFQPEVALGAISEDGLIVLNPDLEQDEVRLKYGVTPDYQHDEEQFQKEVIAERRALFRAVRPAAEIAGRTVIITDDGLATGSTMMAALAAVRAKRPKELLVALPVASPDRLDQVATRCDDFECLLTPDDFVAVGASYEDFTPVTDDEVVHLLEEAYAPA